MRTQARWSMVVLAAGLLVAGCESSTGGIKQPIGGILGGIGGGLAGSHIGGGAGRLAATAGGTLLGAMLGSSIGASLDRADQAYYNGGAYAGRGQVPVYMSRPPAAAYGATSPGGYGRSYPAAQGYSPGYAVVEPRMGPCGAAGGGWCERSDGTWGLQ